MVDADLAEFVDHDRRVGALGAGQQLADQCRLAGAEKPGDDGHRDASAARPALPPPKRARIIAGKRIGHANSARAPDCQTPASRQKPGPTIRLRVAARWVPAFAGTRLKIS